MPAQDRPVLFFPDEQSFRDWLLTNHASVDGVWQGLMHPAGQAEIDRAKADGRWDVAFTDGQMLGG
ncbi:hypothetical protein ACQPZ2_39580 [Nocardia pseudovaccinii]|uniref:hypothetical protein n=1 Tax=Nocardia pseudovaccinii TaxID=189540 RepID=UPI003D949BEE